MAVVDPSESERMGGGVMRASLLDEIAEALDLRGGRGEARRGNCPKCEETSFWVSPRGSVAAPMMFLGAVGRGR